MTKPLKYRKLILGLLLFLFGFIGVLSILTSDIPLPEDILEVLKETFTTFQIKLLTLINPTLMLIIAVIFGVLLYPKVNLKLPVFEYISGVNRERLNWSGFLKFGILFGVLTGLSILLAEKLFDAFIPMELKDAEQTFQPSLALRFLYGGITEEILMRFGLMTFFVWLFYKIFRKQGAFIYWLGIAFSSLLFAYSHFPIVYQIVENPPMSLLISVLIGNSIGGVFFGWLYWKKGLETSMIAHMIAHVMILIL